ncbi:transglutaminase domain-containing protein [Pontimicrobium sp. SW4]|uniref:Transglutaminase domain-containing protein n=1 Tax=Pontimicrobium sp. SW4 TaxID=3153519 RepID=A0AAU7BPV4_9FLAO
MRNIICVFFFICTTAFSQNYELVDKIVRNYPSYSNLETLSKRIKNDFKTEATKARAAYTWIATNINYDIETTKKPKVFNTYMYFSERDYERQMKARLKRKVKMALMTKKALCEGYSAMFVELCDLLNLESIIVKGIAKVRPSEINSYKKTKNHAWNAIKIDGKWELVDVGWGNGFIDDISGNWINDFNDFFFFTKPEHFITSHYPELKKWQLLTKTINIKSFYEKPIFYPHYFNSNLVLNEQQKGSIKVSERRIILNFNKKNKKDNLFYKLSGDKYIKSLKVIKNKEDSYNAIIYHNNNTNDILTLYVNLNPVLGFKIN